MKPTDDPFVALPVFEPANGSFETLSGRPSIPRHADPAGGDSSTACPKSLQPMLAPALARLHGFDLLDQPMVSGIAACPGEVVTARSAIALRRAQLGHDVVVTFLGGDPRQPVILGVIEPRPLLDDAPTASLPPAAAMTHAVVDGERQVIEAEREVVLRCGDASITLTRAGKVLIQGHYIVSRSTGYNKIKGAAIDIN